MTNSLPLIPQNQLKRKLQLRKPVYGTFVVEFRQPSVLQLLSNAGFDFATIDNEHGAFSMETIADLSRAAIHLGITPLVRIPEITYTNVAQTLDVGAQGLMVPRITRVEQVQTVVRWLNYPPQGERGNAMERGLTQFRSGPVQPALKQIQEEILLIIQIETIQAIDALDDILAIGGVDVAMIGPNDLSISLGYPGQPDHPEVQLAIRKTMDACERHGVIPGIHMGNLDAAVFWAREGMRLVSTGSEVAFLSRAAQSALAQLHRQD